MATKSMFQDLVLGVPTPTYLRVRLRGDMLVSIRLLRSPPVDEASMLGYVTWYAALYEYFTHTGVKFAMRFDLSRVTGAPDIAFVNLKWRLTEELLPRTRVQVAGSVIFVAPGAAALVNIVKSIFAQRSDEPAQRVLTCDVDEAATAVTSFVTMGAALTATELAFLSSAPIDHALFHAIALESCAL